MDSKSKDKKNSWDPPLGMASYKGTWIPLEELLDMLQFALNNAYIRMPDGIIRHQEFGIPMGDPLSPGMTILTCAWMEQEWLSGINPLDRIYFRGARYMDDILLFLSKSPKWNCDAFLKDFTRSECYWHPLKLIETNDGHFLETSFQKTGTHVSYRLKNVNETKVNVWRYHHYQSRLDYVSKRATILSTLRKTHKMSSDSAQNLLALEAKCREFLLLGYPKGIIKYMCSRLFLETGAEPFRILRQLCR